MTVTDERTDDETPKVDLTAPDTRAAGRWNSAGMPTERSDQFGLAVRRLWSLLRPERPVLVVVLVTAVVSAFLNVLGPRVLGWGTDVIIDGLRSPAGIDLGRLHEVLMLAIALYAVSAALSIVTAWMIAGVVQRLMQRLRAQAEAKVHALTLRHIDQQARGDLLSRVTNDLDNLAQSLQQTMSQMLTSVLLLDRRGRDDVPDLAPAGRRRAHHGAGVRVRHAPGGRPRPPAVPHPVGQHRRPQRPDRGGLHGPRDREGVRAAARGGGAVPRHQRRALRGAATAPSSCRASCSR